MDTETDLGKKVYEPREKQSTLTIRLSPVLHEILRRAADLQSAVEEKVGEGKVSINDTCIRGLEVAMDALAEEFHVSELPVKGTKEFAAIVERAVKSYGKT